MNVSIIIPLYNKAAYIGRALESVARQTLADHQVIVVDDGSTDDGAAEVQRHAALDPRVRLLRQDNAGPGAARNRGLMEASGSYVAFLDADDEWLPGFLARGVALLERQGPGVALAASSYYEHPSGRSSIPLWHRRGLTDGVHRLDPSTPPQLATYLLAFLSPCSIVARTEALRRWGGYYEDRCLYAEDSYLFLKVLLNEPVVVNLEPLAVFHREASALSRGWRSPRPVEPFLTAPETLDAACPPELRPLLAEILAIRAEKTACVLGYWGRWREADELLRRFRPLPAWRRPRYWAARLSATPTSALIHRLKSYRHLGWQARLG